MELIRHVRKILAEKLEKEKFFTKLSYKNDGNVFAWVASDLSKDLSASIFSERQSKDSSKRQKLLAQQDGFTSKKNLSQWHNFTSETARPTTQPHISTESSANHVREN